MCGIWASIGFEPSPDTIGRIAHRGPDGEGRVRFETTAGPLVLAHRRLAIYDLDPRANQPMTDRSGRYTVVFNGAIYNFQAVRAELERLGRAFRTSSDTEVLVEAYAAFGPDCLARFNGMFAFALYDREAESLFAARDRFGIKPLYVFAGSKGLAFASEIKQLLAASGDHAVADADALHDFLAFGLTDHAAATCFAGIVPLPPGHYTRLDLRRSLPRHAGQLPTTRWYSLPAPDPRAVSADAAAEELKERLLAAIELRLEADVPVGSCLSGGIDSTAIVGAIAARERGGAQHTVSAVYPGAGAIDESRYVDAVTMRHSRLVSHLARPDAAGLQACLDRLVWHQDEPFATTSIYAQWCVFETARAEGLTVMLDGQGADELFGGYRPMCGAHLADLLRRGRPDIALAAALALRRESAYGLLRQGKWLAGALLPDAATGRMRALVGDDPMAGWLRGGRRSPRLPLREAGATGGDGTAGLSRRMIVATSLPMLLRFEDRNSMAHAIEARLPFLDYRLIETALRLGGRFNIRDGISKWILRQAAADFLPPEVQARRDKIGFATPESGWLRGPLREAAGRGIEDALAAFPRLFDADRVRAETALMLDGRRPYDSALWRLWCAGAWARLFNVSPS